MVLEDVAHFRETKTMSQAQKFRRRKTPMISLVGAMDERVLWRIPVDMIIEAVCRAEDRKDYDSLTDEIIINFVQVGYQCK